MLRYALCAAALTLSAAAQAAEPASIAAKATASVARSPKWDRIEVQRASRDDYALVIWYRQAPAGYDEVDRDTKVVGRSLLKALTAEGRLPSKDELHLVVRARMPEVGETGKKLVRVFGVNRYFASDDRFTFERNK